MRRQELRSAGEWLPEGWDSDLSTKDWTSGQRLCSRGAGASDKEVGGTKRSSAPRFSARRWRRAPRRSGSHCRKHKREDTRLAPAPFSLLPSSRSPQTWGGRLQGQRGVKFSACLAFSGCLRNSPFLRPPCCPGKAATDTHGAHEPTRLQRARKSRGGRNEGGPRASQHPQRARHNPVTILEGTNHNPQPRGLPAG